MKKLGMKRSRWESEDLNPMNYVSNLSDAMLILAVGIMLALIVHWNVDISTSGGTMSDSGVSYASGSVQFDSENAASISEEELQQMEQETVGESQDESGMEKAGEIYYDPATGAYYIVKEG